MARELAKRAAQLPARAVARLIRAPNHRLKLVAGDPPTGPEGIWSAAGADLAYDQRPTPELLTLAFDAAREAATISLPELVDRAKAVGSPFARFAETFPGEHYRLLAGLVRVVKPRLVVEVGTFTGASALAFLSQAAPDTRLVTYDVVPWDEIPQQLLVQEDFDAGRLEQRIGDLTVSSYWASEHDLFAEADLVFLDGPKDGVFEPQMLRHLAALGWEGHSYVLVIDDIRFLQMIDAWHEVPPPKLDLTSFGHWSGTGIALVGPLFRPGRA